MTRARMDTAIRRATVRPGRHAYQTADAAATR
jgi:hypothetical protein